MYWITIFFLYPIWRTAKSKGYDAKPFVVVTAAVACVGAAVSVVLRDVIRDSPWHSGVLVAELVVPAAMLILVTLLMGKS